MTTKIKICGITRREDAEAAFNEGAAAIGFIFVRTSPRYIDPDDAKEIIRSLPPFVTPVGVIAETSRPEALALIAKSGVRCLQVHGEDGAGDFKDFPIPSYRVFRVSPQFKVDRLKGLRGSAFMLDTFVEGKLGGTGQTFDWNIALQAKQYGRVILSGGINPENVGDAIRRVSPYSIDVSSGVERSAGVKDHEKIGLLFEAVRRSENGKHNV
jgi:phosphoribosylanthranilate isomerase